MGHSSIGYGVPSFRVWCSSACMFFPINSAGSSYPRMRAAEGFEKRQVPSESQPQIASEAESSIRRIRSSLFSRMSSACMRIMLPSESDIVKCGSSGPEKRRNAVTYRHQSLHPWHFIPMYNFVSCSISILISNLLHQSVQSDG